MPKLSVFPQVLGPRGLSTNLLACGDPAMSNFADYAGPLTEIVLLGNLAVWSGKKIEWDAKNLKASNAPEVDVVIRHEYRKGWSL